MKNYFLTTCFLLASYVVFAQAGHIMQGVGAVNMSMGGAATAQPLDISGALHWNPAAISTFDENIIKFDIGLFFSSPELFSTVPTEGGPFSGNTEDDRGVSPMPALAMVWGKEDSKHTFGASMFGISGFGVTFPESTTNPINMPQSMGGFGLIESDYMLLQIGVTWAYELSDKFSIGVEPTFNYSALELAPNPIATPSQTLGYPTADNTTAFGFGGQVGVFYDSGGLLKLGASYKTEQSFGEFDFDQKYLDGSTAPNAQFTMNYPSIFSVGLGLSGEKFDFALDYRYVDYENTDGFEASGWSIAESGDFAGFPTGAVEGFGWKSMSIVSAGFQYKGFEKLPLRLGYTFSSNPIEDDLAFFSVPATAIIAHAFQLGFSYPINDSFRLDGVYHYGMSDGKTEGMLLNPIPDVMGGPWNANTNPLGAVPGSNVAYDMTTSMIMFGVSYTFNKKEAEDTE